MDNTAVSAGAARDMALNSDFFRRARGCRLVFLQKACGRIEVTGVGRVEKLSGSTFVTRDCRYLRV